MDFLHFTYEAGPIRIVAWEVLYVIGLVLVLAALLNRWLFKPILGVLGERTSRIDEATGAQDDLLATVEAKRREEGERLAAARRRAVEAVDAARREAEARRGEELARAREAAEARLDAAEVRIRAEADVAEAELRGDAQALARRIASQVLGREVA